MLMENIEMVKEQKSQNAGLSDSMVGAAVSGWNTCLQKLHAGLWSAPVFPFPRGPEVVLLGTLPQQPFCDLIALSVVLAAGVDCRPPPCAFWGCYGTQTLPCCYGTQTLPP